MRKILLASAAMLTATAGVAFAQSGPGATVQSAYAGVSLNAPVSAAGANNNNNITAAALPGPTAIPTPGTFVIRLGGRVNVEGGAGWSSLDNISTPGSPAVAGPFGLNTTAGSFGKGAAAGTVTNAAGQAPAAAVAATRFKKNAYGIGTYMRLYPGLDAMATNGLRYGAGTEIRMNAPAGFNGLPVYTGGASSQLSAQTLFVRRAFVYVAGDHWGLIRVGQADGTIGLFDGGVTTGQNWSNSGVFNGGDASAIAPGFGAVTIPFYWLSLAGNEYGSPKIVYVSPKFAGFTGSVTYAPSANNLYNTCTVASSGCSALSSSSLGSDANRFTDFYEAGVQYLDDLGPVNLRAYAVYVGASRMGYTGPAGGPGTPSNLYNDIGVYNGGIAATFAGFTAAANYIGGAMNGQLSLKPAGAPNLNATTASLQYVTGPLTLGVTGAVADSQGSPALVGSTQLHEYEISFGGRYVVAPGLAVSADYIYQNRKQNGFNFATGGVNTGSYKNTYSQVQGQAFLLGMAVNW